MSRERSFWGWGLEGAGPSAEQAEGIAKTLSARFGGVELRAGRPPRAEELELPAPRVAPPGSLAALAGRSDRERAGHTYGKAYRDVVRGFRGEFPHPPDWVAYPEREADVAAVLDWAAEAGAAVVPYGAGSSVVGGVEGGRIEGRPPWVSLDLSGMGRVLEIDRSSRAARIQAGALGPALEDQLRPHGLTLRHFPQSFEFSTLGGWIATRSGGHYATLHTHIDDFVESIRAVTPAGLYETRRLPGSGAGPSPDRLLLGSEGTLGVVTEAWMRLQDRPVFRGSASVRFPGEEGFQRGAEVVRQLAQSGLHPSNCRLLDATEAMTSGAGSGTEAVLVLGFESADHPVDAWMARAAELCRDGGGELPEDAIRLRRSEARARGGGEAGSGGDAAGAWRKAFLQAPYVRDVLVAFGVVAETFETAVPWDGFERFHASVMEATREAVRRECGTGQVACRFTHVYPDGPAPYYSVLAPGRRGSEIAQWDAIKAAAMEAVVSGGGTVTHHHAVGRDHRPGYDRERPEPFAAALRAAKGALDPKGVLNPGVLVDP